MTSPNLSFSLRTIRIIRTDRPTINDASLIACEKKRIVVYPTFKIVSITTAVVVSSRS